MWGMRMNMSSKKLKPEHLNGIYAEIANLLGVDVAAQLHRQYRGTQISFPVELICREYIFDQIKKEYTGTNIRELATKYGYTEKWIRKIVKNSRDI